MLLMITVYSRQLLAGIKFRLIEIRETLFVKFLVRQLLRSYAKVCAQQGNLSGKSLYREVLLHSNRVDKTVVDSVLEQAEDSADFWTTGKLNEFGFRQVVHFLVLTLYMENGHQGTNISFREIVYSLIPSDL